MIMMMMLCMVYFVMLTNKISNRAHDCGEHLR